MPTTRKIDVSVVIVTWNSRALIDRCLAPLQGHPEWMEVLVHDNASADGTAEYVAKRYPWVRLYPSAVNLGFGAGNNRAFEKCRGRNVLLLNPDAFLDDVTVVERLLQSLERDERVAAVGPQLVHEDGRHQVGDAGWRTSLRSLFGHVWWAHRLSQWFPSIYISNPAALMAASVSVDWICGACLMVRARIIEDLGGFDEGIFMYGEDVEWGERMRDAGYALLYLPQIKVLHLQGGTQKADGELYFSTKWLDARAIRFSSHRSSAAFAIFRQIAVSGFTFRGVALWISSLFLKRMRVRSRQMFKYAKHARTLRYARG